MFVRCTCVAVAVLVSALPNMGFAREVVKDEVLFPDVAAFVKVRVGEFDQIAPDRRKLLEKLAQHISRCGNEGKPIQLNFICTHNSRRSHLSQIWASVAAAHYGTDGVKTFSGGTEGTAFNPRAVATLQRAGLQIDATEEGKNPRYAVRFGKTGSPLVCFSKAYGDDPNPKESFCAILVCSDADKKCPVVEGADLRLAIPFSDPKISDGTPQEAATYDERCAQICREMLYVFSKVAR